MFETLSPCSSGISQIISKINTRKKEGNSIFKMVMSDSVSVLAIIIVAKERYQQKAGRIFLTMKIFFRRYCLGNE